jgi:hypothetical protein
MIDVKQAVLIAKEKATEMLGESRYSLEEIERETYKGLDVWSITLGLPRDLTHLPTIALLTAFSADRLQYKRFLIEVQTGEFVAMKLREVASQ